MLNIKVLVLALVTPVMLSGCYMGTLVKHVTDKTCSTTPKQREALKEQFDGWTEPNKVRVYCAKDEVNNTETPSKEK